MTFISSLMGLASVHAPGPKISASSSEMKLHVTASSRPRAAAARRTLRSTIWDRVAVGFATPGSRGRGVETTWS